MTITPEQAAWFAESFGQLADNVEQMQFEYGLDLDGNNSVDRYAKASGISDWHRVVMVRVHLIVRGDALGTTKDDRIYDMGDGFCYGPASSACAAQYTGRERYQRRLVVKDILVRNRIRK